jgi:carboxymethylenebutenolidase
MSQQNVLDQTIYLDRGGREIPIYIARPEKQARRPGVIIVHEIFGLNEHIKDVARRFALKGMVAFAPDLFEGSPGLPEDRNNLDAMRAVWQNIPDSQLIDDLQAVYRQAAQHPDVMADKVGTIGFCMGGAIALMFACSSHRISWVADYYGRILYPQLTEKKPKHPIDYMDGLRCPAIFVFGGQDELILPDHIEQLKQRMAKKGQKFEVKVYPEAKHAFFNDQRELYNEAAAKDAWQTTLDFVANSIRLPGAR